VNEVQHTEQLIARVACPLEVTPPGSNVLTSVHEYGGGAWWVHDGVVFSVEFDDQRLRRIEGGGEPVLLPPEPVEARALRFADGRASNARRLAGNGDEALQQPEGHGDGTLTVVTDRTNGWNLYDVDLATGDLSHRAGAEYDIVEPHWGFGGSRYTQGDHIVGDPNGDWLASEVDLPYTSIRSLREQGDALLFVGASFGRGSEVVRLRASEVEVLRPARDLGLDSAFLPTPGFITFPTTDDDHAHGLYYAPTGGEILRALFVCSDRGAVG